MSSVGARPRRQQDRRKPYLGHPKFEGFDVILSERKSSAAADGEGAM